MTFANDLDAPQFLTSEVCSGTRTSPSTLKNWVSKKSPIIVMKNSDRRAHASGSTHRFSLRRVIQIGITSDLVKLGVNPRPAAKAAIKFTDFGDNKRPPGFHFASGNTFLVIPPGDKSAHIVNVTDDASVMKLLSQTTINDGENPVGITILNLTETETWIRNRLGIDDNVFRADK